MWLIFYRALHIKECPLFLNRPSYFQGTKCPIFNKTRKMGDYFKFWFLFSNNKVDKYVVTSLMLNELFKSEKSQSDHQHSWGYFIKNMLSTVSIIESNEAGQNNYLETGILALNYQGNEQKVNLILTGTSTSQFTPGMLGIHTDNISLWNSAG